MRSFLKLTVAGVTFLSPLLSVAHPGHGHDNPLSPGHYISNPQHAIPILLAVAFATMLLYKVVKQRSEQKK